MNEAEGSDVELFLRERVTTFDQLELLRLLYQDRRAHLYSELASSLSMPQTAVAIALGRLEEEGLIRCGENEQGERVCRATESAEAPIVEKVMRAYDADRSSLMKILNQNAIARVRAKAAAAFAQPRKKDEG